MFALPCLVVSFRRQWLYYANARGLVCLKMLVTFSVQFFLSRFGGAAVLAIVNARRILFSARLYFIRVKLTRQRYLIFGYVLSDFLNDHVTGFVFIGCWAAKV